MEKHKIAILMLTLLQAGALFSAAPDAKYSAEVNRDTIDEIYEGALDGEAKDLYLMGAFYEDIMNGLRKDVKMVHRASGTVVCDRFWYGLSGLLYFYTSSRDEGDSRAEKRLVDLVNNRFNYAILTSVEPTDPMNKFDIVFQ